MDSPSFSITRGNSGCRNAEDASVSASATASATAPRPTAVAPGLALAFWRAPPAVLSAQERQQQEVPPPLEIGAVAPDFGLPAATRWGLLKEPIRLSDYRGKIVVLAFFPRARTSGCTVEMRA